MPLPASPLPVSAQYSGRRTGLQSAIRNPQSAILLALLLLSSLPGCAGYQVGQRSLYRPDIRTVYVPVIQSNSFRRYLGERLTEAVVKEIELKTPYKVVDSDAADSVLTVKLVSESKRVLTENFFDEPRDIETDFFVQLSWVDRRGDLIMSASDLPAQPLLLNISQTASFVPEAGQSINTAQQEAIQRLAEQVVGQMELAW
jgi:Lipopolysaccharide-assembly